MKVITDRLCKNGREASVHQKDFEIMDLNIQNLRNLQGQDRLGSYNPIQPTINKTLQPLKFAEI